MKSKASETFKRRIRDVVISEYAMRFGVSRTTIYDWANGIATPSDKNKRVIHQMERIPESWWFRDA